MTVLFIHRNYFPDAQFFIAEFGAENPAQELRKIAFSLRGIAPISYWDTQNVRELREWLEILEKEAARRKK